jgi:hypothetical protein
VSVYTSITRWLLSVCVSTHVSNPRLFSRTAHPTQYTHIVMYSCFIKPLTFFDSSGLLSRSSVQHKQQWYYVGCNVQLCCTLAVNCNTVGVCAVATAWGAHISTTLPCVSVLWMWCTWYSMSMWLTYVIIMNALCCTSPLSSIWWLLKSLLSHIYIYIYIHIYIHSVISLLFIFPDIS